MFDQAKPNIENITTLVEVLRTTDLPQARGYLNVVTSACECTDALGAKVGMCCLGIACEQVPGIAKEIVQRDCLFCGADIEVMAYGSGVSETAILPPEAQDFYGFDSNAPLVYYKGSEESAVTLNDSYRKPFTVIGDAFASMYLGEDV